MYKKVILLFLIGMCLFLISDVSASETIYYVNSNGVEFSKSEYEYIGNVFYDGYQELIDYDSFWVVMDYYNGNVSKKIMDSNNEMRGTFHETNSKKITITSICTNDCLIAVVAEWKKMPIVRSYDLIGAFLDNVSLIGSVTTQVYNGISLINAVDSVSSTNGFGAVIKLPTNGNCMKISQFYRTTKNGNIYASYQHATSNITLTNSKKFSISYSGLGHVFLFNNTNLTNMYDGMQGVNISI